MSIFDLPVGANPATDMFIGMDDLGRKIQRTRLGATYTTGELPAANKPASLFDMFPEPSRMNAASGNEYATTQTPQAGMPSQGMGPVGLLGAIGQGLLDAIQMPGRAAAGREPTLGDILNTAGMVQLGAAGMPAPKGALRSGSLREAMTPSQMAADDILQLLKSGRGAEVTDEMMAAADPQYLWANYDLPMDAASRAERAQGMGFSDALHGTGSNISAVDAKYFGSGKDALGSGFYTTTKPSRANIYAPKQKTPGIEQSIFFAEGSNVIPLMVKEPKPFDLAEQLGDAADEIAKIYAEDPSFKVSKMSSGLTYIEDINGNLAKIDPYKAKHWALQDLRKAFGAEDVSNVLSQAGYSGVKGPEALGGNVRVSYNPADVRSRFARFDPRLSHLANLSAGLSAAGLLGAGYTQRPQRGLLDQ